MSKKTCKYDKMIFNPISRRTRKFKCTEPCLDSGHCILHDPDYLTESTESKIKHRICQKIDDASKNGTVLECIGYNIPALNMENKTFSGLVYFTDSKFEEIVFDYSEFSTHVDFSNCKIENEASFSNIIFKKDVIFTSSNFSGKTNFDNTKFAKKADFSFVKFKDASFFSSEFNESDFSGAVFTKSVSFGYSEFNAKTDFSNTNFENDVNFSASKFIDETNFTHSNFSDFANFRGTLFLKPSQVFFESDLSRASFLQTDISRVKFGNQTKWNLEEKKGSNLFSQFFYNLLSRNNKFKIYDEWLLEKNQEPTLQLENVMDVYRNLRENYDWYLRYEIAGEFFVREMELKRKYKKNKKPIDRKTVHKNYLERLISPLGVYHLISQYGHSISRPVYASIPFLGLFTILFCFENTSDPSFTNTSFENLLSDSVFRSISNFFPFYSLSNQNSNLDTILKIILLPISGTFFIALKRKLERKFRH